MKFQSQPNRWSCSVASAAMVMDEAVQDLIGRIGHDGGEIVFPHLPEPTCRAGFARQEIIDAALKSGWSVTPIEAMPACTPNGDDVRDVFTEERARERMESYFNRYSGVVEGERIDGKYWHNVAWDHNSQQWFDPSGPILPRDKSPIKVAYFLVFMKNEHKIGQSFLQAIINRPKPKSLLDDPVSCEPFDVETPLQYHGPPKFA